ncbi:hypothetical protein NLU13_7009 [Sarocladium strictum]|uniref:Protein kinase domain-containing protein n=1 Tax=Sarocladium strictum TaxID=5046 RepID=A0AA39L6E8_SARSR|nr:hypothetical protein NLU13_7009 [Sarocladium strictum]
MMELEAITTSIEICWKTGELIVKKCQNYRHAHEEVDERINQVEAIWDKTRQQTDFLRRIDDVLDAEYRRIVDSSIGLLGEKLSKAVTSLYGVLGNEHGKRVGFHGFGIKVRKGKYAFLKETLDEIIKDLEDCHRRFDPTWYLVMRMATPVIDQQLQEMTRIKPTRVNGFADATHSSEVTRATMNRESPLFIARGVRAAIHAPGPPKAIMREYLKMDRTTIPYSTASLATRWSSSKGTNLSFIIDSVYRYPGSSMEDLENDVRNLAKRLTSSDPYTFGLLRCKCPMRAPSGLSANSFELVLHIPEGMGNPKCLRQMLLQHGEQPLPSLTRRLRIAQQLANSISYVHNFNFVHKGVCPESVLLLEDIQGTPRKGQKTLYAFLVGFGNFRAANGDTVLIGDAAWERNIYRHPERQGEFLQDSYRMQHDVYSLGVCLLEIGLWESFVEYDPHTTEPRKPQDSKSYQEFRAWADARRKSDGSKPEMAVSQKTSSQVSHSQRTAVLLREYLLELAEARLPHKMGELYKDVVVACLSSGESEKETSEDELDREAAEDKDGISVGVHYIEEVLDKLARITL